MEREVSIKKSTVDPAILPLAYFSRESYISETLSTHRHQEGGVGRALGLSGRHYRSFGRLLSLLPNV
jgi:hypothetical protein